MGSGQWVYGDWPVVSDIQSDATAEEELYAQEGIAAGLDNFNLTMLAIPEDGSMLSGYVGKRAVVEFRKTMIVFLQPQLPDNRD